MHAPRRVLRIALPRSCRRVANARLGLITSSLPHASFRPLDYLLRALLLPTGRRLLSFS